MDQEKCHHCGASMRKWKHTLSQGLVNVFIKFCYAVKRLNRTELHLQTDVEFSKNEYNNFQKLHYFGLVAKGKKSGCWVITKLGTDFFLSRTMVPKNAITFRDRLQARDGQLVSIQQYFTNEFRKEYWQRDFDFGKRGTQGEGEQAVLIPIQSK